MDTFITRKDLAQRWHTSTGHLANLAYKGQGPRFTKIGTRVLYKLSDIEAYEGSNVVEPISRAA